MFLKPHHNIEREGNTRDKFSPLKNSGAILLFSPLKNNGAILLSAGTNHLNLTPPSILSGKSENHHNILVFILASLGFSSCTRDLSPKLGTRGGTVCISSFNSPSSLADCLTSIVFKAAGNHEFGSSWSDRRSAELWSGCLSGC